MILAVSGEMPTMPPMLGSFTPVTASMMPLMVLGLLSFAMLRFAFVIAFACALGASFFAVIFLGAVFFAAFFAGATALRTTFVAFLILLFVAFTTFLAVIFEDFFACAILRFARALGFDAFVFSFFRLADFFDVLVVRFATVLVFAFFVAGFF